MCSLYPRLFDSTHICEMSTHSHKLTLYTFIASCELGYSSLCLLYAWPFELTLNILNISRILLSVVGVYVLVYIGDQFIHVTNCDLACLYNECMGLWRGTTYLVVSAETKYIATPVEPSLWAGQVARRFLLSIGSRWRTLDPVLPAFWSELRCIATS